MTDDQLRWAGAEFQLARLQEEIDHTLRRTWRGRLILLAARLVTRLRHRRP